MTILLTGARGQLGAEIMARRRDLPVHGAAREELDITDRAAVFRIIDEIRPACVVNAAAYTAVDRAESESGAAFAVNRDGPANLAAACAAAGLPLIHVSTDYVFDGSNQDAYNEDDPVAPLGVYGASKEAGEQAVRRLCPKHMILRTAWLYGPHGRNFVGTMLRAGAERDRLRVVDDQHGSPTFAGDLAEAVLTIVRRMLDGSVAPEGFGTFHCAGAGLTTWCRFARKIFEIAAPQLDRTPVIEAITSAEYQVAAKRPANSVLDCSRLERVHGIRLRPWEEGLSEMLAIVLAGDGRQHIERLH